MDKTVYEALIAAVQQSKGNTSTPGQITKSFIESLGLTIEDPELQQIITEYKLIIISDDGDRLLTAEEELSLVFLAQKGDREAMASLIKAYDGWIKNIVYARVTNNRDDAEATAKEAFIRGVQAFDITKGARLSGYTRYMIEGALTEFIADELSKGMVISDYKIRKAYKVARWLMENTSYFTDGKISDIDIARCATDLGIEVDNVKDKIDIIVKKNLQSTDIPESDDTSIVIELKDPRDGIEDIVVNHEDAKIINDILDNKLSSDERDILKAYYTVKGENEGTYQDLFDTFADGQKMKFYRRLNKAKDSFSAMLITSGISACLMEYVIRYITK